MLRLTVKNLLDKKVRFALTTLAVVAGVTMVVAVFVLTDSLRASFDGLASDIAEGADLTVRSTQTVGSEIDRDPVPEELAAAVGSVEGVDEVVPGVFSFGVTVIDGAGEAILPSGPPRIGTNWSPAGYFLTDGDIPEGPQEFAVDVTTAGDNDLQIGSSYTIAGPIEQRDFELVGVFNFGSPDEHRSLGQTMSAFDLDTAQDFLGLKGSYSEISLRVSDSASVERVQAAVAAAVGADYEVITSEVIQEETQSNFGEVIDVFNWILLVFAFIIVFVAAFIINNTFQIVVAQRIRELGLLRAVGATGRQISRSVRLEALLVGVFSTVVGIGLGLLGGVGLRWVLNQVGFSLPAGPILLQARTVVFAALIGIGVTFAASLIPARRASTISPIAASPSFARPMAQVLGRPIAGLFKTPGKLAQGNASRSPRRTASTAGALMIGLALVAMAGVVGASITKTFIATLDDAVQADYFVQSRDAGFGPESGFVQEAADAIEALPEIDSLVRYRFGFGTVAINGSSEDLFTSDFALVEDHLDGDVRAGSLRDADPAGSIAVHVDPAEDLGLEIGDVVEVTFPDDETERLIVAAVYADASIFGNWMIDNVVWEDHITRRDVAFATGTIAGFSDDLPDAEQAALQQATEAALEPVLERFPSIKAENRVDFRQGQLDQLNSLLAVIQVLLALSLAIALIGIANTLALSVFERTREIGLLRAVGMTRRQLRRAVRWEAVIIAVFGALLGTILGVVFGVAAVVAIPDSFISAVSIPVASLVVYVIVAALAGILAAIYPAWRASRMNVLDAIYHE